MLGFIVSMRLDGWTGTPRRCSPAPEAAASESNSRVSTFCHASVAVAVVAVKTWHSRLHSLHSLQAPESIPPPKNLLKEHSPPS